MMKKKKRNVFEVKLDAEEQELLDSIERDEWKSVKNIEEERAFAKAAAAKVPSFCISAKRG